MTFPLPHSCHISHFIWPDSSWPHSQQLASAKGIRTTSFQTMPVTLYSYTSFGWGTRWRIWLRHCTTSRKVSGSIPDGVTGIFHWHNPSGRTMALGLTQPLTEMSTRNISWGKRRPVRRADNLTTFMCRLSWNMGASTSWNPQGLSSPVMGLTNFLFYKLCLCKWSLPFMFSDQTFVGISRVSQACYIPWPRSVGSFSSMLFRPASSRWPYCWGFETRDFLQGKKYRVQSKLDKHFQN